MLNDKLKSAIEDKVWETTKETYEGDRVTHNSIRHSYRPNDSAYQSKLSRV